VIIPDYSLADNCILLKSITFHENGLSQMDRGHWGFSKLSLSLVFRFMEICSRLVYSDQLNLKGRGRDLAENGETPKAQPPGNAQVHGLRLRSTWKTSWITKAYPTGFPGLVTD